MLGFSTHRSCRPTTVVRRTMLSSVLALLAAAAHAQPVFVDWVAGEPTCESGYLAGIPVQIECPSGKFGPVYLFDGSSTYFNIDRLADCTADCTLSIDDFICFQTAFALGC